MAGFLPDIPKHLFEGSEIWTVTVGASTITFDLENGNKIMLQPYGVLENRGEWLYDLPLCGEASVQSLCGQTIESISDGKTLDLVNDDPPLWEMVNFMVGDDRYLA